MVVVMKDSPRGPQMVTSHPNLLQAPILTGSLLGINEWFLVVVMSVY